MRNCGEFKLLDVCCDFFRYFKKCIENYDTRI